MEMSLHELAQKNFHFIEKTVARAAVEYAMNAVWARDEPVEDRRYLAPHRAKLLAEFDRLNSFFTQHCDGWLLSSAIQRDLDLASVPLDPAAELECDSCQ